jgi:putative CocE/NonD family hydrolase
MSGIDVDGVLIRTTHARVCEALSGALALSAMWAVCSISATAAPSSSTRLEELLPGDLNACAFERADRAVAERQSIYLPMEDGVRLALDIYRPKGPGQPIRVPTLYTATRYWRSEAHATLTDLQKQSIASGYALVDVDVRGTGASFGQWYMPYAPQEAKDLGFVARWIARQPWSNGKVVMSSNSYPGTTPWLALAHGGSAITAIAPRFSDFDMFTDLLWPGGVIAEDLIVTWGHEVREMDLNHGALGRETSVRPVDGAEGEALLQAAIKDHEVNPWSSEAAAHAFTFADEHVAQAGGLSINDSRIYRYRAEIEKSGAPIFGWGSWLDSGIAQGLLNRFMTFKNPQLTVIGPWIHGARADANPFDANEALDPSRESQTHEIYCFLNRYARDGAPKVPPETAIFYFTMGENRWKQSGVWPIAGTRPTRYYLNAGKTLSTQAPSATGLDSYRVDFDASTGPANRWATQAGYPRIDYGDRAAADRRLLVYDSVPLANDMEVTGQAVVTLRASSTHTDGNFIVYLEDVAPDGRVTYVTEGELRALHRKLSKETPPYRTSYPYRTFAKQDALPLVPGELATLTFQLQATSVRFKAGHRLRLAIAGADKGTFLRIPAADQGDVTINLARGGAAPSFIELPVIPLPTN